MLFVWRDPGKETSEVEKLREVSLADSGLHEEDIENLISKRIEQLIRTDQLMVIMQERPIVRAAQTSLRSPVSRVLGHSLPCTRTLVFSQKSVELGSFG